MVASPKPFEYRTRMDYVTSKERFGLRRGGKFNYIVDLEECHLIPPEGGRAVPPGDPEALAAALTELLTDAELRERMGSFNRELVERRYSWDAVVDELESIYDELLSAPSAAR